jgi:hypothetical protein
VVTITKVEPRGLTIKYSNGSIEHSVSRKRITPRTTPVLAQLGSSAPAEPVDGVVALFAPSPSGGESSGDDGGDGEEVGAHWRNEIHMTRGARSFVGGVGASEVDSGNSNFFLSCLESDGLGGGGVDCGGGDERSQHRHRQQRHDKRG